VTDIQNCITFCRQGQKPDTTEFISVLGLAQSPTSQQATRHGALM